ncbi:MAG: NAD(P)-binding domain-containing protein [Thermoanaerobaculia bacterium]
MSESTLLWSAAALLVLVVVLPYLLSFRRRIQKDRERKQEAVRLGIDRPAAQFPFVDPFRCIGCAACVDACPEGDVLGVVGGTAVVVNGLRCVGHAHCEEACPVGAIEVGLGDLKSRRDVPLLDNDLQTTAAGIYVAGELGGLALVKNAAQQGREAIGKIAQRARETGGETDPSLLDVAIVGAGPAGLSAALAAVTEGLTYRVIEKEESLGGSLLHYPRRKMVLTQPVELPPWGRLDREEYQKEKLLELFELLVTQSGLRIDFGASVTSIGRDNGVFTLHSSVGESRSRFVLLALGRRGSPRKLGVPGEELPKVMYRLMDAESYRDQRILVVGGGDSAAEAAIGLARQPSNEVTLSYRKEKLVRLKKKNLDTIEGLIAKRRIRPALSSSLVKIEPDKVLLRLNDDRIVEVANDYVFIFAGGVPPFDFLRGLGIRFGGDPEESGLIV